MGISLRFGCCYLATQAVRRTLSISSLFLAACWRYALVYSRNFDPFVRLPTQNAAPRSQHIAFGVIDLSDQIVTVDGVLLHDRKSLKFIDRQLAEPIGEPFLARLADAIQPPSVDRNHTALCERTCRCGHPRERSIECPRTAKHTEHAKQRGRDVVTSTVNHFPAY
jgi:hypothetical protein